jgi:MFS family permease
MLPTSTIRKGRPRAVFRLLLRADLSLVRSWQVLCPTKLVGEMQFSLLVSGCNGIAMLICGRFINGICVGITSSQVPVYLAEISRKETRGSIIVIQQWAIEWGIFIMYFAGYGCHFIPGPKSFRTAWAIQLIPAVFLMLGIPFLPRSPRWLAKVGREKEAIAILADIQAGGDVNDPLVVVEWEEITTILAAEREGQKGWRRFIKNGMWRRTFAGTSVQAWQQLSGANVMTYYVVYIFEMANLTGNTGLVSSGIQYAIFIVGTAATFFFIDKTGRRPLLVSPSSAIVESVVGLLTTSPSDLWCNCYGYLHVRGRRRPWNLWYISTRWAQWQPERESPSDRVTGIYSDCLLLFVGTGLFPHTGSYCVGLRRRSLVPRDSSYWDGSCFRCELVSLLSYLSVLSYTTFTGSSTSQSDSSFHQPSRTSPGSSSLFSVFSALEQQRKHSSRTPRQRARLWKKSKSCSRKEDHIRGRRSLVIVCWMRRFWNCNVLGRLVLVELLAGRRRKKLSI